MGRPLVVVCALFLASAGCRDRVAADRVSVEGPDALWGGGGFCARAPSGLACWSGYESIGTPVVVQGLTHVTDVALHSGEGCALHDGGVACFRPGDATATLVPFEAPAQVVASSGYGALVCVLHAKGVSCWSDDARTATLRRALGKPNRLFAGTGYGALCAVYDDGTRCFPIGNRGETDAGIFLPGVKDPKGVMASTIGGDVWVVDGDKALYGAFSGTLAVTGNPFASQDPLAVGATFRPFTGATVTLRPVDGIGAVRAMAAYSISPLVLDERGVAQLDFHGGSFDVKRWPTDTIPTAIFTGFHDDFFTVDGGVLHQRGWDHGNRFDREVTRVAGVKRVIADTAWTCALDTWGVGCIRSPKI